MMLLRTDGFGQLQILPKRASRKHTIVRRVGSVIKGLTRYPEGYQSLRAALTKGQVDKARARRGGRSKIDQRAALKNQRLDKATSYINRRSKKALEQPVELSTASNLELTRKSNLIVQHQC